MKIAKAESVIQADARVRNTHKAYTQAQKFDAVTVEARARG